MPDGFLNNHRAIIISAAARANVPAVYCLPYFVRGGGLLYYGPDQADTYRRAAAYVDRILRGARPEELPVQFPTKFEMIVNLKTAKAMGLSIPESFLLRADAAVLEAMQRWANDDLRSLNAQVEYILRQALRGAGRLPGPKPGEPPTAQEAEGQ